ncbi:hypothetical protein [Commensalibacter sp. Nvir]
MGFRLPQSHEICVDGMRIVTHVGGTVEARFIPRLIARRYSRNH